MRQTSRATGARQQGREDSVSGQWILRGAWRGAPIRLAATSCRIEGLARHRSCRQRSSLRAKRIGSKIYMPIRATIALLKQAPIADGEGFALAGVACRMGKGQSRSISRDTTPARGVTCDHACDVTRHEDHHTTNWATIFASAPTTNASSAISQRLSPRNIGYQVTPDALARAEKPDLPLEDQGVAACGFDEADRTRQRSRRQYFTHISR